MRHPNPTIKTLARLAEALGKELVIRFEPKPWVVYGPLFYSPTDELPSTDPHWSLAA